MWITKDEWCEEVPYTVQLSEDPSIGDFYIHWLYLYDSALKEA